MGQKQMGLVWWKVGERQGHGAETNGLTYISKERELSERERRSTEAEVSNVIQWLTGYGSDPT